MIRLLWVAIGLVVRNAWVWAGRVGSAMAEAERLFHINSLPRRKKNRSAAWGVLVS